MEDFFKFIFAAILIGTGLYVSVKVGEYFNSALIMFILLTAWIGALMTYLPL